MKSESALRPFDNTSVLVSSTSACRNQLTILHEKLDGSSGRPWSRLKWPLNSKEHQETIEQLRVFAESIQFALTVDGCALLSKTSSEVVDTLKHQLETIQLVESIGHQTLLIERSLQEQGQADRTDRAANEREKVLDWVCTINHEQKHHDLRLPRVDGTGEWFLDIPEYRRWRDEPHLHSNVLWCQGIQGSGKSVLTSLVIDQLKERLADATVAIAHFYLDYRDQETQSAEDVIASLLKQVALAKS